MIPGTDAGRDSALLIVSHLAPSGSLWGSAGRSVSTPPGGYEICVSGRKQGPLRTTDRLVVPATSATPKSSAHPGATWKLFWAVGAAWAAGPLCTILPLPRSRYRQPWAWGLPSCPRRRSPKAMTLRRLPAGSLFGPMEHSPAGPRESAGTPGGRDFCPAVPAKILTKLKRVYIYNRQRVLHGF